MIDSWTSQEVILGPESLDTLRTVATNNYADCEVGAFEFVKNQYGMLGFLLHGEDDGGEFTDLWWFTDESHVDAEKADRCSRSRFQSPWRPRLRIDGVFGHVWFPFPLSWRTLPWRGYGA